MPTADNTHQVAQRVAPDARVVYVDNDPLVLAHARALLALPTNGLPLRIAGHYALAHWLGAPPALVGRGVAELSAIATAAMPGVLTVSETLASALFASGADDVVAECVGELDAMRLFAVAPPITQ